MNNNATSFFDLGKARQTVYSILMGFVLKFFFEHIFEIREEIKLLDIWNLLAYGCVLFYFFLNCFRFLFGLVDYSNMTDEQFYPQDIEWVKEKFWENTFRQFVINTGIFQLIIFSFSVFFLFPIFTSGESAEVFVTKIPDIIFIFCISTLLLLAIDIFSLFLFKKYVKGSNFDKREKARFLIWYASDIIEIIVTVILLIVIINLQPNSGGHTHIYLLFFLVFLVTMETISAYRYIENWLMYLMNLLGIIKKAIHDDEKEE